MWHSRGGYLALILVYTGDGKGKTCACVGQATRALGQGLSVAFGQFIKRANQAGEQKILQALLGQDFRSAGPGFFRLEEQRHAQREAAIDLIQWARMKAANMLILDEALYALNYKILFKDDLVDFFGRKQSVANHLVLSGRHAPQWLLELADLVTEMRPLRHYHDAGYESIKGLEY